MARTELALLALSCAWLQLSCATRTAAVSAPAAPSRARLDVWPERVSLAGRWSKQRLMVTERQRDGTLRDVTSAARFQSKNAAVAFVEGGVVKPAADGVTTITVSTAGGRASLEARVERTQATQVSFLNYVWPALSKLGCNATACHGARAGKGGLQLSLFGAEPQADYDALTRAAGGRRIDRVTPLESLVFRKLAGATPHQGGVKLKAGTAEFEIFSAWLTQGAPYSHAQDPHIVSLAVHPPTLRMAKDQAHPLLVSAVFSDGSQQDVTADATYLSANVKVASITDGLVKAAGLGESAIVIGYMRRQAVVPITVPQVLQQPFPPLEANNRIDELVYRKLRSLGIPPSPGATDFEFLRRVRLDATGVLPTAAEVRAFLADDRPDKRGMLIERLLASDEFTDFWTLKWSDLLRIKSEYPVRIWPKAVAVYYQWVRESVAANKPYDQFVHELITSNGSNFRNGPANFVRAVPSKDPQTIGETAALLFLGARFGCARCHGHPSESWSVEDHLGLGAFFGKVNFKPTLEWKEEIVYSDPKRNLRHPSTRLMVAPKTPGGAQSIIAPDSDPRLLFAEWLTSPNNPFFTRNIVNRIWFWLLGRGIVQEPDDLRDSNPPENPELLDYLAKTLVENHYDLKSIFRLILNSRTYQRSSMPNRWNTWDEAHFSHYRAKRLSAEQLLDAVSQVTGIAEKFISRIPEPFSNWPVNSRAAQLSDGNAECSFLDMFGRPGRDTPYEEERSFELSLRQALYFLNSEQLAAKISASPLIRQLAQPGKNDGEIVDELYLATLSRFPKETEKRTLLEYLAKNRNARAQAVQDVAWAVLNAKEFLFNH
ncbi:MAG: DUF1553 domain-containing protein [Candidatus Solibacter usitatus]|nr:DUF1553 domain-containing protein [Candidatus Solibacter usitatus]